MAKQSFPNGGHYRGVPLYLRKTLHKSTIGMLPDPLPFREGLLSLLESVWDRNYCSLRVRDTVTSHGKLPSRVSQIASARVLDVCCTREWRDVNSELHRLTSTRKDDVCAAHHVMKIVPAFCLSLPLRMVQRSR